MYVILKGASNDYYYTQECYTRIRPKYTLISLKSQDLVT